MLHKFQIECSGIIEHARKIVEVNKLDSSKYILSYKYVSFLDRKYYHLDVFHC